MISRPANRRNSKLKSNFGLLVKCGFRWRSYRSTRVGIWTTKPQVTGRGQVVTSWQIYAAENGAIGQIRSLLLTLRQKTGISEVRGHGRVTQSPADPGTSKDSKKRSLSGPWPMLRERNKDWTTFLSCFFVRYRLDSAGLIILTLVIRF